jgi:drug/metabolite transporter (DMT)-like permease
VELGQAYPILRGTGPIVVFLASLILLEEPVSGLQLLAFFLIAVGILSLSARSHRYFRKRPETMFYALVTGVLIGTYTVIDGVGVRISGNVLGYICWLFFLEMLMVQAYAFYCYKRSTIPQLIKLGWSGVWAGLLAAYAYGSVLWAMESAPIMLVAALRETSVVMASILGILILNESKDLLKVLAAIFVTTGIVLLKA